MNVFKTQPEGFAIIRKQALTRFIPVMLLGVIVVLAANYSTTDNRFDTDTVLFTIPIMLVAVGIGIYNGLKKRRKLFDSFSVAINEDTISRTQEDTPELSLNRLEISSISKDSSGIITIRGMSAYDIIQIPAGMERGDELEAALLRIMPFSEASQLSLLERFGWITGVVAILLMMVMRFVENKAVVIVAGVALIALLIWGFVKAWRNKNIPERYKRSIWIMLLLIAAVIMAILMKLGWVIDFWQMNA
jgi:Ca2+/Na+ antiporter